MFLPKDALPVGRAPLFLTRKLGEARAKRLWSKVLEIADRRQREIESLKRTYSKKIEAVKRNKRLSLVQKEEQVLLQLRNFQADCDSVYDSFERESGGLIGREIEGFSSLDVERLARLSNKTWFTRPVPDVLVRWLARTSSPAFERFDEWRTFREACDLFSRKNEADVLALDFFVWVNQQKRTHTREVPKFLIESLGVADARSLWKSLSEKARLHELRLKELFKKGREEARKLRASFPGAKGGRKASEIAKKDDKEYVSVREKFERESSREVKRVIPGATPLQVLLVVDGLNSSTCTAWLPDPVIAWAIKGFGKLGELTSEWQAGKEAGKLYSPESCFSMKKKLVKDFLKED